MSRIKQLCELKLSEETDFLKKQRAEGVKTLGYFCSFFPPAFAAGFDLRPVRLLCNTSSDSESAGEKIVRADVCPHVKSILGNVNEGNGLHAEIDIWAGLYTCDQMRRGMNCLSEDLGQEVHPVQVPATRTPESAEYYASQMKRFASDIEARHDLRFCDEHALKWLHEERKASAVLSRAAFSGEVSPADLHAMFQLFFIARPYGLAEFFEEALASSDKFRSEKRIVLTGSPLTYEDSALLEELEKLGIGVVPLNCTGLNAVEYGPLDIDTDDLISSLALSAFHMPACIRSRPNRDVYERIGLTIKETHASGLVVKCLKFCDQWYTERERMKQAFDLPVLVFDSDYASGGRERILSRLDAFMEML